MMNASSIFARKALASTTTALKTVALNAASLDAARCRAKARTKRAEKKTKKAMSLVKKVVKLLKAERKAKETKREKSESPEPYKSEAELEEMHQRYQDAGHRYLEQKAKLERDMREDRLSAKEYKLELENARIDMATVQLKNGWGDIEFVRASDWIERKAECMAWQGRSECGWEEKYWRTLAFAAECVADGSAWGVEGLLSAARDFLNEWGMSE
ncbi:hypothetical protein KCU81_g2165, partial [Aureobasidium melanogenum]|uniref:Uncharacterized protein n=1 Tax=Aureobasidium melanogenum (strain CBS 110374) TaxID=1043003 RepID=A0A074VS81_AURM1